MKKELDKYCDSRTTHSYSYRLADPSFSLCKGCPFNHSDDCLKETAADFEALEELYFKAKKALELYQQEKIRQHKIVGVKFIDRDIIYAFKNNLGKLDEGEEVLVKTKYGYAIGKITSLDSTFDIELAEHINKEVLYKVSTLLEKEKE